MQTGVGVNLVPDNNSGGKANLNRKISEMLFNLASFGNCDVIMTHICFSIDNSSQAFDKTSNLKCLRQ